MENELLLICIYKILNLKELKFSKIKVILNMAFMLTMIQKTFYY